MQEVLKELIARKGIATNDAVVQELNLLIKYINKRILEENRHVLNSTIEHKDFILDVQQKSRDWTSPDAIKLKGALQRCLKNADGLISCAKDKIKASLGLAQQLEPTPTVRPH